MKSKVIVLYTDLEGTLLRETDGKFDSGEMHEFLTQIDTLQQQTGAEVQIHIVSPIDEIVMNKLINAIDGEISTYNTNATNPNHTYISKITSAAAYPMEDFFATTNDKNYVNYFGRIDPRIMQLPKPPYNYGVQNPAGYGKERYVKLMTEDMKRRSWQEILMSIYCGNGRNDLLAMDFIRAQKGGIVICPSNSRKEVQAKSHHVSQEEDLAGIIDGLEWLNLQIKNRLTLQKPQEER